MFSLPSGLPSELSSLALVYKADCCAWLCTVGQEVEPGQKRKAVVLHVDMLKLEVHVSLHQDLLNRRHRKVSSVQSRLVVPISTSASAPFSHAILTAQRPG